MFNSRIELFLGCAYSLWCLSVVWGLEGGVVGLETIASANPILVNELPSYRYYFLTEFNVSLLIDIL